MRDEKEERKKQARSKNKQGKATQHTQGMYVCTYIVCMCTCTCVHTLYAYVHVVVKRFFVCTECSSSQKRSTKRLHIRSTETTQEWSSNNTEMKRKQDAKLETQNCTKTEQKIK